MSKRRIVLMLLVGWLIGVASGLGIMAVTGSWYEYHYLDKSEDLTTLVNYYGWELVPGWSSPYYLRRPRLRLLGASSLGDAPNLKKLSAEEQHRFIEIMISVGSDPVYLTPAVHEEYWALIRKAGLSPKSIESMRSSSKSPATNRLLTQSW